MRVLKVKSAVRVSVPPPDGLARFRAWFGARSWAPHEFQEASWRAFGSGRSGLIHIATGAGKTYAAYGGPLGEMIDEAGESGKIAGLRVLYVTPLRAVSRDIEQALALPIKEMGLGLTVESRTGDTKASVRARQRDRLPNVLVTTPESLSLMLTRETARAHLAGLTCAIVDEWHELLTSKRGTQTELALARLRAFAPAMRTWALSATLENLDEAAGAVVGGGCEAAIIHAPVDRPIVIESVLPRNVDRFPWAGHMGLSILPEVIAALDPKRSTIIFTNTRSQAETWYQAILAVRPAWESIAGLHHGSIDRSARERIERGLKDGSVRLVVATSSLDLGVDFGPVERVFQIGSPKGIARLVQRAGRSGHRPGETCRIVCVPTHAMEMIEIDAVRRAVAKGSIEPRRPLSKPLDVLAQHMVTCGLGGGFVENDLFDEVRRAWSYRDLTRVEFDWALSLVREGGTTLRAYPNYHRVRATEGVYRVPDKRIAQLHRLNVGTITGSSTVPIRYTSGKSLGHIEESFVAALHAGDLFVFAGRTVEFVRMHELAAYVRPGRGKTNYTPIWSGTRLPISESLGQAMRETLERAAGGEIDSPELLAAASVVQSQSRLSRVPAADELLIELCDTREGSHLFAYPFDGRLVHAGIAALLGLRLARLTPGTFSIAANDYGFELLTARGFEFEPFLSGALFDANDLVADAQASVNMSELAKRQFREIARVSGLVFQTYPGAPKSTRQLQASSSLIFEVFQEFDPGNLLLGQATREVMERQFEQGRLGRTLLRLQQSRQTVVRVSRPTPLGLPLVIERVGGRLSTQTLADRIEQMKRQWETDLSKLERAGRSRGRLKPPSVASASA